MKQRLSILFSTLQRGVRGGLLFVALLATTSLWAEKFQLGDLYYKITSSSAPYTVEVTYEGSSRIPNSNNNIVTAAIPAAVTYNGMTYSVTSIGDRAFFNCRSLTSVTIPNSVTSIGDWAFADCSSLVSMVVESGNTKYDSRDNCNAIIETATNILIAGCQNTIIPNSVTSIGDRAFQYCSSLTSITIPNSVTSIGDDAFYNCDGLTSVTIPNSVTSIGDDAFWGCFALSSVTIPNSVTSIGEYAFCYCYSLTSITIPNSVTSIGEGTFNGCELLTSVTIPNSVKSIGERAFYGCFSLTSITIPNSVTSIGSSAFSHCSSLTSITIPNSVTSIGDSAFYHCSRLTSITIPNSVTSIGEYAFSYCSSLTSVVWNAENCADFSWEDGNDAPFYDIRSQITSFTFGDSVQHIPAYLCYEMDNLTSMNIPNSIMSIGDSAFIGCTNFKSITWNAKSYNDFSTPSASLFYDSRSQITSFAFGEEVEHIPAYLCYECAGLREISLGSQVKTIGAEAFAMCPRIYEVTCLAPEPPVAELSSFTNYDAYFHAPCDAQRYYSVDPVWKNFHNVECIVTENTVMDDITITPSDYEATVVWLSHEHAATYSLVITRNGDTYCTLTFNKYGQLINIALAPARARAKQAAADYTEKGYSFTITGLDAATTYDYTFSVLNDAHETLDIQYGTFTTQSNTTTSVSDSQLPIANCQKTFRNGQLIILRDGVEYNAMGVRL